MPIDVIGKVPGVGSVVDDIEDLEATDETLIAGVAANAAAIIAEQNARIALEQAQSAALAAEVEDRIDAITAALAALSEEEDTARTAEESLSNAVGAETDRALAAEALLIPLAQKGAANGVAPLSALAEILDAYIPASIARDAEVDAKVAAEVTARNTAIANAVAQAKADIVGGASGSLDALNELAAAIGNDPNFAATIAGQIAGKQAGNANLTALSGLALAANKVLYSTGANTLATSDFTAWARGWLALTDAAGARTALGLGTAALSNVGDFDPAGAAAAAQAAAVAASQPVDATLTALSGSPTTAYGRGLLNTADTAALTALLNVATQAAKGLLSAADKAILDNLAATYQPLDGDLSAIAALATDAFGRGLLTKADAAAIRAYIGLGTAATHAHTDYDLAGVGSGKVLAQSQRLTTTFTMTAAATEEDVPNATATFTFDGRPVRFVLTPVLTAQDQNTVKLITLKICRSTDNVMQANSVRQTIASSSEVQSQQIDSGPWSAWPSDGAAFVVGNQYTVKLRITSGSSSKASLVGVTTPYMLYVITA